MPWLETDDTQTPPVAATEIKARALNGVKALGARTGVSVLLRAVSSLTLARLLFPHDYGIFAIASYITGLGMFLCDVGLGGALVRQEAEPSKDEAVTVFFSQQAITGLVVLAVIGTAPWLEHLYHLSPSATAMLVTMACGLFLSSLRVVPMMALERTLQFPAIARCEMVQNVVQTGSTIALALAHCGPWALAGGGLIGNAVGLASVWATSPWRPQGRFRWPIVVRLARFGIPFQLNALVPSIVGGWMPLVVGRVLGVAAVGLVGWAGNIASVPMMLSGVLNRVAFPAYSRLQSDPAALSQYLQASLRRVSAVLCLAVPVFVVISPVAIPLVFGRRWDPAIPLVQWFSLECVVLTLNGLLAATQNALGRADERLAVTLGVGAMRWGLGYFAAVHFGLVGIGVTTFLVSALEMAVTASLLARNSKHHARLLWNVSEPLLTLGVMLGAATAAGMAGGHGSPLVRATISLLVLAACLTLREVLTGGRVLVREFRGIMALVRPVRQT